MTKLATKLGNANFYILSNNKLHNNNEPKICQKIRSKEHVEAEKLKNKNQNNDDLDFF